MAGLALDHVFVFVEPGAFRRRHAGQGTTNVCYCFDDAYLELIWEVEAGELDSAAVAAIGLPARARWRRTGASRLGIALRGGEAPPFAARPYAAPFLPPGGIIPVAEASRDPAQPFLFWMPGGRPPATWTDGRAGERQRAAGLATVAGLEVRFTPAAPPHPDLAALAAAGLLTLVEAPAPGLVLTLAGDDGRTARRLLLPELAWLDPEG
ncbi:MAG: hypothetical protein U1E53_03885 [Dongiaceae bacterium]